jgi:hypothetical protein
MRTSWLERECGPRTPAAAIFPSRRTAIIQITLLRLFRCNGSTDTRCMPMDLTLACLLILLGAMISYLVDEQFAVTARITEWIDRQTGE